MIGNLQSNLPDSGFPVPEHLRGQHPPMDWNVVHEAARLVELAAVQIRLALMDGDEQMETLSGSFVQLAGRLQQRLGEGDAEDMALLGELQKVVMACQFYDRLSQRLNHAGDSLEGLGELMLDEPRNSEPLAWSDLHERIKSSYSTREEAELFAAAEAGASFDEMTAAGIGNAADDDDIELF